MSFTIFKKKKPFLGYKNKKLKKSKNWHFSKRVNPWFWSTNGHFFKLFFLRQYRPWNVFYDILQRKNSFLGYKNKKFKSRKIHIFTKVFNNGFCPKITIIPTPFFLPIYSRKNFFDDILAQKIAFLGYKNKKFKKSKNWHFSKGVNPSFW